MMKKVDNLEIIFKCKTFCTSIWMSSGSIHQIRDMSAICTWFFCLTFFFVTTDSLSFMWSDKDVLYSIILSMMHCVTKGRFLQIESLWLKNRASCDQSGKTKNPSIYNVLRWVAWTMGQTNCRPSIWCSKYYFSYTFYRFRALKTLIFLFL